MESTCRIIKLRNTDLNAYEGSERILEALASKVRLAILDLMIQYDEVCTCELVPALNLSQPTITVHLNKLYDAGIIEKREIKKFTFYHIRPKYRELVETAIRLDKT
ncbi:ArsR family transcriptional regulator [Thermoplasma sp. Kam2015]|uniref:ArsR/SmtB family transcription factor n=1 Tax=Thermoplasma sp. Kam2015 TaxID=2094122 RepID=UPI000D974811|nr:metalloregulator ArsR/SmtB family transcription factor [Thermoplasma sp. Kam2015]PYB67958.1 ArsR family transcriptional regulator [Thermoplasma sp. Kam2015]